MHKACPNCGTEIGASARFCHECGRALTAAPPAGAPRLRLAVPVVAAMLLAALAGVLFVLTAWAWGLVALLGAVVVVLVAGAVRSGRARVLASDLRMRASVTGEAMAARSRGHVELFRSRRELADLEAERGRRLLALGRAVYDRDEVGRRAAREAVDESVRLIRAKEAEIETAQKAVEERVERAQAQARPTVVLEAPPEPPRVPEPWPPPDEADRPSPEPDPGGPEPSPGTPEPSPGTDDPSSPVGR